ncbi:MAG: hypothetical protein LBO70_04955 [Clostridiales Family XIII bacterium]|jgi:hypothetical protein|nr:hypothetical protein [Clostridiales Family XIII bacterium]
MGKKKVFGTDYHYSAYLSEQDTLAYLSGDKKMPSDALIASLSIGVLRIDAVLYKIGNSIIPRYEIFINANENGSEWICYDSPDAEVCYGDGRLERGMFEVLDAAREKNGLSYKHADFKMLTGKRVKKESG